MPDGLSEHHVFSSQYEQFVKREQDNTPPPDYESSTADNKHDDDEESISDSVQYSTQSPMYTESNLIVLASGSARVQYERIPKDQKARRNNPLNPPPSQFNRPVSQKLGRGSEAGDAYVLYSIKRNIYDGFPEVYPEFVSSHDVSIGDWKRFIEDLIHIHGKVLRNLDRSKYFFMGNLGAYLTNRYFREKLRKQRLYDVQVVVEAWNLEFFMPRKIFVRLQTPKEVAEIILQSGGTQEMAKSANITKRCRLMFITL